MNATVEHILTLFRERGNSMYGGEDVTQVQHALQGATFARRANATPALVTATLLHDVGHLLHDLPDDAPDQGIDDLHENLAARFLETHFGPDVVEPVRLHVAAKRYLCATKPGYMERLSAPSIQSLALQGGPMSEAEVADFEALPFYKDAVRLRVWDDLAKDPEMVTEPVEAFAADIETSLGIALQRPQEGECNPYFMRYINLVPEGNYIAIFRKTTEETLRYFQALPAEKLDYRYAEGKWSIKEVLMHLMDTERIMAYRALVASRMDSEAVLPNMDETVYAAHVDVSGRSLEDMLEEFIALRTSTEKLLANIPYSQSRYLVRHASGSMFSARAVAYVIVGHVLHHLRVLEERYV
ncbi:MAG: HD domain-containing protein [Bacteroidetes bacterium]|nr:MAG: HD domain-containing protein [Bacteroidota bacterium]